ncbi:MAG TPA: aspartate/glutamate racemase family protein, partial [Solirubrobacterales bacterium]|nr:aspartate/glutamate racemase family protein [Solirubrobacterales bacterium]
LIPGDVELDVVAVKNGPETADSIYDVFLMDMFIFEAGLSAEADGCDAVCIDTVSDSGMKPLRSRLGIPVVGPGQVACHVALLLSEKFSFLATWGKWEPIYRKIAHEYGLSHRVASIRSPDLPPDLANLITDEETYLPPLLEEAEKAISEDGAGSIVLASTTMWQAHDYLQERLDVPVINPGVWSFKLAELFVRMGKSQSKRDFPPPPKPVDERIFAALAARTESS